MMRFNASLASATPTARQGYLAGEYPQGITTKNGIPCKARILVTEASTYRAVASTVTSESGTWLVAGLDTERRYNVIARDTAQEYSDVVAVRVLPTALNTMQAAGEFTSNADLNGVSGQLELIGGLPPYVVSKISPLPTGLTPVLDGHILKVVGTSKDVGIWNCELRVESSNDASLTVKLQIEIQREGFKALISTMNPMVWLRFNELTGSAAFDSSGNGRHAAYGGVVELGVDPLIPADPADEGNKSMGLKGGGYVRLPGSPGDFPMHGQTFLAVLRADRFDGQYGRCVLHRGNSSISGQQGPQFNIANTGHLRVDWYWAGGWRYVQDNAAVVSAGSKHLVGISFSDNEISFFVDGVVTTKASLDYPFQLISEPFTIGNEGGLGAGQGFDGVIDEFLVFNKTLSADEVAAIYATVE